MTSNAENEKRGELAARADGRCWAEHTTEYEDLRRVAAIEFQPGLDCYKALCDGVHRRGTTIFPGRGTQDLTAPQARPCRRTSSCSMRPCPM